MNPNDFQDYLEKFKKLRQALKLIYDDHVDAATSLMWQVSEIYLCNNIPPNEFRKLMELEIEIYEENFNKMNNEKPQGNK